MPAPFDPRRLTLARRLKKLSKKELAERVQVSPASITQYEAGRTVPAEDTQARLALACGVAQSYFARTPGRRRPDFASQSFFRSLRASTQVERDQADAMAEHVMDIAVELDARVHLPDVTVPSIPTETGSREEIEKIAATVREIWGLDGTPVPHMVRLLEYHGVVVARLQSKSPESRLDAFSKWFGDRPLVVLWADKSDKARSRFDAAHELGHLVMHSDAEPASIEQERQANFFAAAFLMPTPEVDGDLCLSSPTASEWSEVFSRRAHWGVSAKALLYRSRQLGALPEIAYRRSMQNYNRLRLADRDGSELGPPESVLLLAQAQLSAGLTTRELSDLVIQTEDFVCETLGVERDQMTHETEVVRLSEIKGLGSRDAPTT